VVFVKFALHRQELVIGVNMRILKRLTKEKIAAEKIYIKVLKK
jgi:hypothetical protein